MNHAYQYVAHELYLPTIIPTTKLLGNNKDAESDDEGLEGLKNEDGMNGMTIKRRNEGIDDRDDE